MLYATENLMSPVVTRDNDEDLAVLLESSGNQFLMIQNEFSSLCEGISYLWQGKSIAYIQPFEDWNEDKGFYTTNVSTIIDEPECLAKILETLRDLGWQSPWGDLHPKDRDIVELIRFLKSSEARRETVTIKRVTVTARKRTKDGTKTVEFEACD